MELSKNKWCLSACDDFFSLILWSRLSALFTSWAAFLVFSAVNALVLGLEALRIARSHALNPCFLTTSHTVACYSRLAPLTPAHQPTIYFVQNLFSLFAALRFEYKAHFLFVGGFFCSSRLCVCVCAYGRLTRQNFTPHLNTEASSIKRRRR